jgi:DNA helicase-4
MQLINAMAGEIKDSSLYFVGDDWQSIYNFAGSDISLITQFEENYVGGKVLEMGTNYRSTPNVVEFGEQWIMRNTVNGAPIL